MNNNNNTSDNKTFKLNPNENLRFDNADKLRRAADLNYDASEFELRCIIEAENMTAPETASDEQIELIEQYSALRLKPDANIVMSQKYKLKHTAKHRLAIQSAIVAIPAAALLIAAFLSRQANQTPASDNTLVQNTSNTEKSTHKINKQDAGIEKTDSLKIKIQPNKSKHIRKKPSKTEIIEPEPIANREYYAYTQIKQKTATINQTQRPAINPKKIRNITSKEKFAQTTRETIQIVDVDNRREENGSPIRNFITSKLKQTILDKSAERQIAEWIIKSEKIGTLEINPSKDANTTVIQEYDENGQVIATRIFTSKTLMYDPKFALK